MIRKSVTGTLWTTLLVLPFWRYFILIVVDLQKILVFLSIKKKLYYTNLSCFRTKRDIFFFFVFGLEPFAFSISLLLALFLYFIQCSLVSRKSASRRFLQCDAVFFRRCHNSDLPLLLRITCGHLLPNPFSQISVKVLEHFLVTFSLTQDQFWLGIEIFGAPLKNTGVPVASEQTK